MPRCFCRLPQCNNFTIASTSNLIETKSKLSIAALPFREDNRAVRERKKPGIKVPAASPRSAPSRSDVFPKNSPNTTRRELERKIVPKTAPLTDSGLLKDIGGKDWSEVSRSTNAVRSLFRPPSQSLPTDPAKAEQSALPLPAVVLEAQRLAVQRTEHLRTAPMKPPGSVAVEGEHDALEDPFWARIKDNTGRGESATTETAGSTHWIDLVQRQRQLRDVPRRVRSIYGLKDRKFVSEIRQEVSQSPPSSPDALYHLLVDLADAIPRTRPRMLLEVIRTQEFDDLVDHRILNFILERAYKAYALRTAQEIWKELNHRGLEPDTRTCRAALRHYMQTNDRRRAEEVIQYMAKKGWPEAIPVLNWRRQLGEAGKGKGDLDKHRMIRMALKMQELDPSGGVNPFYGAQESGRPKVKVPKDVHTISTQDICSVVESLVQERAEPSAYHVASEWLENNRVFIKSPIWNSVKRPRPGRYGEASSNITALISPGFSQETPTAVRQYIRLATVLLNILFKSLLMSRANRQSQKAFIVEFCERFALVKGSPIEPNHITLSIIASQAGNGAKTFSSKAHMIDWIGRVYGLPPVKISAESRIYFDNFYKEHPNEDFQIPKQSYSDLKLKCPQAMFSPHYYVGVDVAKKLLRYAIKDCKRLLRLIKHQKELVTESRTGTPASKLDATGSNAENVSRLEERLKAHRDRISTWWTNLDTSSNRFKAEGVPSLVRTARTFGLIEIASQISEVDDSPAWQGKLLSTRVQSHPSSVTESNQDSEPKIEEAMKNSRHLHLPEEMIEKINHEISDQRSALHLTPTSMFMGRSSTEIEALQTKVLVEKALKKLRGLVEEQGDLREDKFNLVMKKLKEQIGQEDRFHFSLAKYTKPVSKNSWL